MPSGITEFYSLLNKFNENRKNRHLSPEPKKMITDYKIPEYKALLKKKVLNNCQNINLNTNNENVEISQKNINNVDEKNIRNNIYNKCNFSPTFSGKKNKN